MAGIREVEGILQVSGRMLLRYEESVEAPEAGFDERLCRHLRETAERQSAGCKVEVRDLYKPHFQEDIADFLSDFQEGVECTSICGNTLSVEVVLFVSRRLP